MRALPCLVLLLLAGAAGAGETVKVALYSSDGTGDSELLAILTEKQGFAVNVFKPGDFRKEKLQGYAIVVFPGG